MPRSMSEFKESEIKKIVEEIAKIWKENGSPEWLENPEVYSECVNILNAGDQKQQKVFKVVGKAPTTPEAKQQAETIKKAIEEVTKDIREKEIEISCAYGVGATVGKIGPLCNLESKDEEVFMQHEQGQVLLLDFWATWCPPCQKPMAHNQEMLEKRGADWGKNVRLIGLSIDQDYLKLQQHVREKKWTSVEHYWASNGKNNADNDYGVKGVPHVLLVDKEGKIVFMGHPASRNIENDIDALLKGEKLTGQGTTPAGAEEAESKEADESKEVGDDKLKKFQEMTEKDLKDQKEKSAGLQRAFLVLTNEKKYDLRTEYQISSNKNTTCHVVLMGPQEKLDACSKWADDIANAVGCKVNRQVRAM